MSHKLRMINGQAVDAARVRLDCVNCEGHTRFTKDGETAVKCRKCNKRHSRDALIDTSVVNA